ncbi:MAG TPA: hypothetical protein PKW07_08245 [Syntrophorhabdaceae bacterium]|nr:hypothetical protein [Syntrophorhabdaceae bacterium]
MQRVYVHTKDETRYRGILSTLIIIFSFIGIAFFYFIIRGACIDLREDLIFQLSKEKSAIETNNRLKTELSGITKKRYLEFKAKELGLKKPKEEEVVVLR